MVKRKRINFLLLFLSVLMYSCASSNIAVNSIIGKFVNYEDPPSEISFTIDSFKFKLIEDENNHLPLYKCCNTISYGIWSIVEKESFLEFSSSNFLDSSFLETKTIEKSIDKNDFLTFEIDCSIVDHQERYNEKTGDLIYSVFISSNNVKFDRKVNEMHFYENNFSIPLPDKTEIKSFSIQIIPRHRIKLRDLNVDYISTINYSLLSKNSNYFHIHIPNLSYLFLSAERLKREYIKIENTGKLFWRGKEFRKISTSKNIPRK